MLNEKNIFSLLRIRPLLYCIAILVLCVIFSYKSNVAKGPECIVAKHMNGADATIIQLTDHYFPPRYPNFKKDERKYAAIFAEFLAFKYDIPVHVFEQYDRWPEFKEFLETGRGGASIYYPSCFYKFRVSKLDSIITEIEGFYNRCPTTLSYGCGKTSYVDSLPNYIIGGRNSVAARFDEEKGANTWYGKNAGKSYKVDYENIHNILSRPAGGRFYSDIQQRDATVEEASEYLIGQVKNTLKNNGFYTNFMHWQDYYTNSRGDTIKGVEYMETLFEGMAIGIAGNRTAQIDYNEAIEYLYVKESVKRISIDKIFLRGYYLNIELHKNRPIDYSIIQTPLTVIVPKRELERLNLKTIIPNNEVEVFQDDKNFYLNVLLNFDENQNSISIKLSNEEQKHIKNFKKLSLKKKGNSKVSANEFCKFVLFRKRKTAKQFEFEVVQRTQSYSKIFLFGKLEKGYDYFCGAINSLGNSSIINLNV